MRRVAVVYYRVVAEVKFAHGGVACDRVRKHETAHALDAVACQAQHLQRLVDEPPAGRELGECDGQLLGASVVDAARVHVQVDDGFVAHQRVADLRGPGLAHVGGRQVQGAKHATVLFANELRDGGCVPGAYLVPRHAQVAQVVLVHREGGEKRRRLLRAQAAMRNIQHFK